MIRGSGVRTMNRYVDQMTDKAVTIHDIDCVYRNHKRNFWCLFEWKNPGEQMSATGTLASLQEMNDAFEGASNSYRGLFIVRLGFSIDAFPFTDAEQLEVVWLHCGTTQERTYPSGARSALQHILDHGRLL
jgi:tRNA-binding EMAP/Myf-like protein